jgi:hypothetical protein
LNRGLSTDVGPGGSDLVYGGDPARWFDCHGAHPQSALLHAHCRSERDSCLSSGAR